MSSRAPARGFTQTDECSTVKPFEALSSLEGRRGLRAMGLAPTVDQKVPVDVGLAREKRIASLLRSASRYGFRSGHVPRREQSLHYALTRTISQILLRRRYVCEKGRGRSRRSCWICPATGQRWLALCDLFPIDRFAVAQVGRRSGLVARKVGVDVARCRKANSSGATPPS